MLYQFFSLFARIFNKLLRIASNLARRYEPLDIQKRSVICSTCYDMVTAPDELYYADQYQSIILPHLEKLPSNVRIIDLGCSQGRFTARLAKYFSKGQVIGCDISNRAIEQAKKYAANNSIGNIDFRVQSITECLDNVYDESVNVVLLTEVTFFYPDWQEDMSRIIRILKPGGILIVSFRSQYFYALCLVRNRIWGNIETVLQNRQGKIFGSQTVFTWQTSSEIRKLLTETHGLELLELRGIGVCSGIPGDPHDQICQPSKLSQSERRKSMNLELELGKTMLDCGRYILAIARKQNTSK